MPPIHRRACLQGAGALCLASLGVAPVLAQTPPASEAKAPPLPPLGSPLAVPPVPLLDGGQFDPASADGQVLVLYWWASWCPFCAVVSPQMDKLWREQSPRGLKFLGLSIDKKAADATAYLHKRGYAFPSAWVSPDLAKALPKPKGLPVTLVRGRDGRLVMAEAGQLFPEDVADIARFL